MNNGLLILLESVLGKSQVTSKGNVAFFCPFCNHHKRKLEVQLNTNAKKENPWHCWTCPASSSSKGKTISSLFKKLKVPSNKLDELKLLIAPTNFQKPLEEVISLPKEFIPLDNAANVLTNKITQIELGHAFKFLKKRGITQNDYIKYNIGLCIDGKYKKRIIIPSYDENGTLNYFIARDFTDTLPKKYDNPPVSVKNIIGWELYINWNAPIILCEGIFDALTIKRNVIPLFGKVIHDSLMKKLVKSNTNRIYIALDQDAIKDALKHCETLMAYGKEVYLVELDGKDANEMGFEKFLNIIEHTSPLNFQTLLNKKLEYI